MNSKSIKLISVTLMVLFLSSCGGGSGGAGVSGSTSSEHSGVAQKGPFENSSVIEASRITSNGDLTGNIIKTIVIGDSGNYKIKLPDDWGVVDSAIQINAEGFFVNESSGGKSNNKIKLSSIINDKALLSVNLLTDWAAKRTKALLKKGKRLDIAKEQAEKELSKVFGVNNIHDLDITRVDKLFSDNAQLLLLSGALMELADRRNINSQVIINEIGSDFSEDGLLDKLGDDWFIRMQAIVRDNPALHVDQYAKALKDSRALEAPSGRLLPQTVVLASRPVASLPAVIFAEPGETIVLDGSGSHAEGGIANFTWFRVDQLDFNIPFFLVDSSGGTSDNNARFSDAPSITVPDDEVSLLFALVVTDNNDDTHTKVVKVVVKKPPPENNAPEAVSQDLETNEDVPLVITLEGTDVDNDVLSFDINTPALLAHGILEGTAPNLTYTPDFNFHGTDSFVFSVDDGNESSEVASVTIQVKPVNDRPIAIGQSKTVEEGEALPLLLNGFDVDGDTLSFTHVDVSHGTISGTGANLTYTPEANYSGPDSFTFTVNDGLLTSAPATVSIEVNPVNHPPVANPQIDSEKVTTVEDIEVSITVTGSDPDPGDTANLVFLMESNVTHGELTGTMPNLVYQPDDNYYDTDSFTFKVKDPDGLISEPARVDIVITSENDLPTAISQDVVTNEDTPKTITLSGGDVEDPFGSLTFNFVTPASFQGSLTGTAPNLIYTPLGNFNGTESFTFTVTDTDAGTSIPATVEILVNPVNDPPEAIDQDFTTDEDTELSFVLNYSDIEDDTADLSFVVTGTGPLNGSLSGTAPNLIYTPNENYNNDMSSPDSFSYTVTDSGNETVSATVRIIVNPINDPPLAINYTCTLNPAAPVNSIDISGFELTDPEGNAITQYFINNPPLSSSPILLLEGNDNPPLFINDGILTAEPLMTSPTSTSFEYTVKDEFGAESAPAVVEVIQP